MNNHFDVAIIGAGPAGLVLAKELESHANVAIFDKKTNPHKRIACAEWTPPMFPVQGVQSTSSMVTNYDGKTISQDFAGKIIDRESWQNGLLCSLSHAKVHLCEEVTGINGNIITTPKNHYSADLIVGADGPVSIVRKSLGLPISPVLPAINARCKAKNHHESTFIYFMKEIERGYGWYFPKGEFANIGVGATSNLKNALESFVAHLRKHGMIDDTTLFDHAAGLIPLFGLCASPSPGIALIGDAAGLTDPLTGAGISQAFESAVELAKSIKSGLGASGYAKSIEKTYNAFLERRHKRRKILEDKWQTLGEAVEESWLQTKRKNPNEDISEKI